MAAGEKIKNEDLGEKMKKGKNCFKTRIRTKSASLWGINSKRINFAWGLPPRPLPALYAAAVFG